MNRLAAFIVSGLLCQSAIVAPAFANSPLPPPAADVEMRYYDRHKIDVSNIRDFYENLLIADAMIHAEAMFSAETKWKLTLYQMIRAGSNHHQARSAYQLSLLGTPIEEISAIYAADFTSSISDPRLRAAFEYLDVAATLPTRVTSDTHAALRRHYTDRQIVELFELTGINAAMATHDRILPIATDQETLDWANANLSALGWEPGHNTGTSEEQRSKPFVGEMVEALYDEFVSTWVPEDLTARAPRLRTDFLNQITGYGVSPLTFDGDQDGVAEPFDYFPTDYLRWEDPSAKSKNLPPDTTPPFDVGAYDYKHFNPARVPAATVPFSDRHMLDNSWSRKSGLGTLGMDAYLLQKDRTI
ncbi:MAG: hypothetical protein AAGI28_12065, partial [Pseudomonadota bacterium]